MTKEGSSKPRLVEVATALFAKDGFQSTSLRAIAKEAGVSPALLVHHFGSRDQLIETCITETLGELVGTKMDMIARPLSESLDEWRSDLGQNVVKLDFFRQVMLFGGKNATILFDRMVKEAKQMLLAEIESGNMRKVQNPDDTALVMTMHGLAPLILKEQVDSTLGGSFFNPEVGVRLAAASLEIYTRGIYTNNKI